MTDPSDQSNLPEADDKTLKRPRLIRYIVMGIVVVGLVTIAVLVMLNMLTPSTGVLYSNIVGNL